MHINNGNDNLIEIDCNDKELNIESLLKNQSYYKNHTQRIETQTRIIIVGEIKNVDIAVGVGDRINEKYLLLKFASGNYIPLNGIPKDSLQEGDVNIVVTDNKDSFYSAEIIIPILEA